ncbi:hypothetical protein LBMAG56_53670 [Verrucomicrobiota bacterium]|nr:hypothetical protein LBMAG56_53670 [Verrucomicrobiota bacterium]
MNPRLLPLLLIVTASVAPLTTGCKNDEPPPPPPKVETGAKEVEITIDRAPAAALAAPKLNNQGIPDADFIYNTTRRFMEEQKRPAKDLEELVAKGYMPPLPAPPPGKKYVLNQRAAMIQLVDAPKK